MNKELILSLYEYNTLGSRVHTSKAPRASEYAKINETLYDWYVPATSKNIVPMGPQTGRKCQAN